MAANTNDGAAAAYRKAQIEFVSNNDGTTAREVVLLILPSACGIMTILTSLMIVGKYLNTPARFAFEFSLVIFTSIMCFTLHVDSAPIYCLTLTGISALNLLFVVASTDGNKIGVYQRLKTTDDRCPSLTNFRAVTNVLTAICILAVDFNVFPRKLSKTETYGYSLMDTGVGFFVLSNAMVSREARGVSAEVKAGSNRLGTLGRTFLNFAGTLRDCVPLFALGIARYLSVELLGYQRHVTEYGIHWNFFATLTSVRLITSLISSLTTPRLALAIGIVTIAAHEYLLSFTGFGRWVLNGSKDGEGFLSANREGIASTFGYVGLYHVGVAIGRLVHPTYRKEELQKSRVDLIRLETPDGSVLEARYTPTMILCVKLSLISAQACMATSFLEARYGVSRKLANAGYCAWMTTVTAIAVTVLTLVDVFADIMRQLSSADNNKKKRNVNGNDREHVSSTPIIFNAINYNGLAFFLTCNLFTGAVNFTLETLYVDDFIAVIIITVYMIVSTGIFHILYIYKIQIKL